MPPTSTNPVEANYSANAAAYSQFLQTPLGQLERDLFSLSITACDGMHVLDLGGGTGLRARDALAAGARSVDVVDISPAMMELGKQHEASIGPYDMVIANGIFDHAHDEAELEGMWANAAAYLKEGGKIVANRNDPFSRAAREGKYGVRFTDFEEVEGGVRYHYRTVTEPSLDFESWALEAYVKKPFEIAGRFFEGFENVDWEETEVVKRDREFWREYLEEPILYIFTARKGMGRS
jgi:SAM-dependent methyltransferase